LGQFYACVRFTVVGSMKTISRMKTNCVHFICIFHCVVIVDEIFVAFLLFLTLANFRVLLLGDRKNSISLLYPLSYHADCGVVQLSC